MKLYDVWYVSSAQTLCIYASRLPEQIAEYLAKATHQQVGATFFVRPAELRDTPPTSVSGVPLEMESA